MVALETLIQPESRPDQVVSHVDELVRLTRDAGLPPDELTSIVSTLTYLREESIGQAGRRLSRSLTGSYKDLPPDRFFSGVYGIRSGLIHGGYPRPDGGEIEEWTPHLERFVSALIARSEAAQPEVRLKYPPRPAADLRTCAPRANEPSRTSRHDSRRTPDPSRLV